MRNHSSLNKFFSRDRKSLYIILSVVILSVLTLTVVYAALSTTLNINGNAEVTAASWDIYLDNIQLNSNSITSNVPTITDKTTASFSTTLTKPGDFYEFSVDVVNNGSIDAMINSVTKTPELSDTQKKYLNYIVEYQNGESITTKQLVSKNSFVRLKVKVEFRKDLTASDLPTQSETLNLSFKVNYVQSDDSSENSTVDNNGKLIKIVSGDYDTVGSEICIGEECFYVISSNETSVTMLAKYNLYVGNKYDDKNGLVLLKNPTGIQNSKARGWFNGYSEENPRFATTQFSSSNYWIDIVTTYPAYVYNSKSTVYTYINNYKKYLENIGTNIEEIRLIKKEELISLGCATTSDKYCRNSNYYWTYSVSYWTGEAKDSSSILTVNTNGDFDWRDPTYSLGSGVRPVITISKS